MSGKKQDMYYTVSLSYLCTYLSTYYVHTVDYINNVSHLIHLSQLRLAGKDLSFPPSSIEQTGRVCLLTGQDSSFAICHLGINRAGFATVPLCAQHPAKTIEYFVRDSAARAIVTTKKHLDKVLISLKFNHLVGIASIVVACIIYARE